MYSNQMKYDSYLFFYSAADFRSRRDTAKKWVLGNMREIAYEIFSIKFKRNGAKILTILQFNSVYRKYWINSHR